jgi:hypothetical protein
LWEGDVIVSYYDVILVEYFWREKTQLGSKHWDESMFATYVGEHMGARHGQWERGKAGTHSMEHAVKGQ